VSTVHRTRQSKPIMKSAALSKKKSFYFSKFYLYNFIANTKFKNIEFNWTKRNVYWFKHQ